MANPAWPLVGRGDLVAQIDDIVRGGRGVVLVGPAGVGKTRLAHEVAAAAEARGVIVLRAVASASGVRIPFSALGPLLPDRRSRRGPVGDLVGAALRALSAMAGSSGPALLIADDAQLLDDGSAAVVHQAAMTGAGVVLATVRSGDPVSATIVALWKDELLERLEVGSLGPAAVAELLAAALGGPVEVATADQLWRATEGNALYLRELVLAGLDRGALTLGERGWRLVGPIAGSPRLRDLLEARLAGVTAAEREVLELLAVGGRVGFDLVALIVDAAAAEAAERRGLLVVHHDGRRRELGLAHPLHGEILRSSMGALTVLRLSRRLADEVGALGVRRRDDVLRVARWRLDGGGTPDVSLLLLAADLAHAARDSDLAGQLARAAVEAGGGAEAVLELAVAEGELGGADEVERLLASIPGPPASGESETVLLAAVIRRTSNLVWSLGRAEDADALISGAATWVADTANRAELAAQRAVLALFAGRPADALAIGADLERTGLGRAAVRAGLAVAPALLLAGRPEEALAAADRGYQAQLTLGDQRGFGAAGTHVMFRLWALVELCRPAETEQWLELVAGIIAPTVDEPGRAWLAFCRARFELRCGRLHRATADFSEAASRWGALNQRGPARWAAAGGALAAAWSGDGDSATAIVDRLKAAGPSGMAVLEFEGDRARAWALVAVGDEAGAVEILLETARAAVGVGDVLHAVEGAHEAARLGAARRALTIVEAVGSLDGWPLGAARVEHVRALATEAVDDLVSAGSRLEAMGVVIEAADAYAAAAALLRRGQHASAADRLVGRVALVLVDAGPVATPALAAMGSAAALSPREHEVAALAIADLSNREIADRLHLSERTVENHLQRVFMKLAVTSRRDLAGAMRRR